MVISEISTFYNTIRGTIDALGKVRDLHANRIRDLRLLFEDIDDSMVEYGDPVKVEGTFSEYVPAARELAFGISNSPSPLLIDPLPIKPARLDGYHCGSIQLVESRIVADPVCLPVFYTHETGRPIEEDVSGERVVVVGKLVSLPGEWKNILDTRYPVGIQAESIQRKGAKIDEMGILPWTIVRTKETQQKYGEGSLLQVEDIWGMTFSLGPKRTLLVNGYGTEGRHGGPNEECEIFQELYMPNLVGDDFENTAGFHSSLFEDQNVDASYDVHRHNYQLTDWLERQS